MNRRTFLKSGAGVAALLLARRGWAADEPAPQIGDDESLAKARERIARHRKGDGVVVVRNAQGDAVRGAKVTVEQLRHEFLFGANLFMFGSCGSAELDEAYRQHFAALLNYATLGFYWAAYEAEQGKPQYDATDKVVAWASEHGIACKGHPLAWDHPVSSPDWLPDDPKEIARLSVNRVREIVTRYRGRIDKWDVVNEPTHLADKPNKTKMAEWAAALGAVPYVAEHLRAARAANPNATLLVNDYRIEPHYYEILERSRNDGRLLFDAVGIQSHMHGGAWPLRSVWDVCDTYGKLGVPVHFTETTLVSGSRKGSGENWNETSAEGEARQAEDAVRLYTTLFAHPAVQAITWWDFSDLGAWQGAAAGWLRKDMSAKPVYDRLLSLIKGEWWTKTNGHSDAQGEFKTSAFFGAHRVTAELPNGTTTTRDYNWQRDNPNRVELTVM